MTGNLDPNMRHTIRPVEDTFAAFDALPEPIRRALADAPYNYDPVATLAYFTDHYGKGATANLVAAVLRGRFRRHAAETFQREHGELLPPALTT